MRVKRFLLRVSRATRSLPQPRAPYFLFVGEAGSCLGGMQDYYGAYDCLPAAQCAVPEGVDWAEVAAIENRSLTVVITGERHGRRWRWQKLDDQAAGQAA